MQGWYMLLPPPFYGHYIEQSVLSGTLVKNRRILLEQSFTPHMPLLMASNVFGFWRRC